jgi:hypothetical protein
MFNAIDPGDRPHTILTIDEDDRVKWPVDAALE